MNLSLQYGYTHDFSPLFQEREFQTTAGDAMQKALEVLYSSGWKVEKESSHGDTIYSKLGPRGTKIYKLAVSFI